MMTTHREFERMAAAPSTLTAGEHDRLVSHLHACPSCRQTADAYRLQDSFLRSLRQEVLPRSALASVLENSSVPGAGRRPPFHRRFFAPSYIGAAGTRQRAASLALFLLVGLALLSTVAYAAGSIIRVYHPEGPISQPIAQRMFWVPSLPPYPTVHYRALDPQKAADQSGYAVAYLQTPPADTSSSVGVDILPHVGWPDQMGGPRAAMSGLSGLAVAVRSVVRYRGTGHTTIVLLNEPSPKAIRTRELVLGERTVHLPDGREAWATNDVSGALPFIRPRTGSVHVLAWVSGDYVVSIFSDLPGARLKQLAVSTAVVSPKNNASQRAIPSDWPAPMPLERLPARLQVVADGAATYGRTGTKLTVRYTLQTGYYSQGALYGLDKWKNISIGLAFPSALQRHANEPPPHFSFPGGSESVGGDIVFSTAGMKEQVIQRSLRHGLTVRLAWTEQAGRRSKVFHFRIIPTSQCNREDPTCMMTVLRR